MSLRVPRHRFVEQMTYLRDEGYDVVPLQAVADGGIVDRRVRIAITFDDGYRSQEWAADVLREFGFPATFFVVPRFLDGIQASAVYWERWGHLRWDEVARLLENGFDVGSHSATHPDLRKCSASQLDEEIAGAKGTLEQRLGRPVTTFSYPSGRHDRRVRRAVEKAGYQLACTSRYGLNRKPGSRYAVHRTEVTGEDDLRDFRCKLQGRYDWLGYWQDVRPTP